MKKYEITMTISGVATVIVPAESRDQAERIADQAIANYFPLGEYVDVDHYIGAEAEFIDLAEPAECDVQIDQLEMAWDDLIVEEVGLEDRLGDCDAIGNTELEVEL